METIRTEQELRAVIGEEIPGLSDYNKRWVGPEGYKGIVARQLQAFKKAQAERKEERS